MSMQNMKIQISSLEPSRSPTFWSGFAGKGRTLAPSIQTTEYPRVPQNHCLFCPCVKFEQYQFVALGVHVAMARVSRATKDEGSHIKPCYGAKAWIVEPRGSRYHVSGIVGNKWFYMWASWTLCMSYTATWNLWENSCRRSRDSGSTSENWTGNYLDPAQQCCFGFRFHVLLRLWYLLRT